MPLEGAEGVDCRGATRFFARLGALVVLGSFRASAVGRRARLGMASGVDSRDAADSDSESEGAGDDNGNSPPSVARGVALDALATAGFRERFGVGSETDTAEERAFPFFVGVSTLNGLPFVNARRSLEAVAFLGVTSGVLSGESPPVCSGRGRRE